MFGILGPKKLGKLHRKTHNNVVAKAVKSCFTKRKSRRH